MSEERPESAADNVPEDWYQGPSEPVKELVPLEQFAEKPAFFYCSIDPGDDRESQEVLFWMLSSPAKPITDHVKEPIFLVDVLVHPATSTDPQSGEVRDLARIVLLDSMGQLYESFSPYVYDTLKRIFAIFGRPPYATPVVIVPQQTKTRAGRNVIVLTCPPPPRVQAMREAGEIQDRGRAKK